MRSYKTEDVRAEGRTDKEVDYSCDKFFNLDTKEQPKHKRRIWTISVAKQQSNN